MLCLINFCIENNILYIVGIAAFFVSNPVGWVILGGITLVSLGGLLTYYADDLNQGWTVERMSNFIFDIGLSLILGVGFEGRVGKIVLAKEVTHYITRESVDNVDKLIFSYAMEYGLSNIEYVRYGTFGAIIHTTIGNTDDGIIKYLFVNVFSKIKSVILDYYYNKEDSWIYSYVGEILCT